MNQLAKNIFLLMAVLLPLSVIAQPVSIPYRNRLGDSVKLVNTAIKPPRIKQPPRLRGSLGAGIQLNSNGYSLVIDKGYLRGGDAFGSINRDKFFQVRLIELEIGEIKHPKEKRANNSIPGLPFQARAYILGKVNNFYQVKLGYGRRQLIAGKPDPGTVSIHWVYLGGFAAGLLKPYYLKMYQKGEVKYSEQIGNDFITPGMIIGKAPFSKGLSEIKLVPGIYLKTGLSFDFASNRKGLIALEAGISGAYYTQEIQQMVLQDSKQFFFNFYAALHFGKRW